MLGSCRKEQINTGRRTCLRTILLLIASGAMPVSNNLLAAFDNGKAVYPLTIAILQQARLAELAAHVHYSAYIDQALAENYPNIAYLFEAFATSESIHAGNYTQLLLSLKQVPEESSTDVRIGTTRQNLRTAAGKEMTKIKKVYPELLDQLQEEEFTPALKACNYSWQSHRQHEKQIRQIKTYSGWFFNKVADRIEGGPLDFHVCDSCGSTVASVPEDSCQICNLPISHYRPIVRPGP